MLREITLSNDKWCSVEPNMIYNRFDLWGGSDQCALWGVNGDGNEETIIPVLIDGSYITLGVWRKQISNETIEDLCKQLFEKYKAVDEIRIEGMIVDEQDDHREDDYRIDLPETEEELENRNSSKMRYNLKREKRVAQEKFGSYQFDEFVVSESEAQKLVKTFFLFKKKTMGFDTRNTVEEYVARYHVSHVYDLKFGDRTVAVLLSAEQCPGVFLDNLSYDPDYSKYSPGRMIYDLWLKRMVEKKKSAVYLGGGDYDYKSHYQADVVKVAHKSVYRNGVRSKIRQTRRRVWLGAMRVLPKGVKNLAWRVIIPMKEKRK